MFLYYRSLGSDYNLENVAKLSRDELEKDLDFVALILFRNELKPDSRNAIEALKEGEVELRESQIIICHFSSVL